MRVLLNTYPWAYDCPGGGEIQLEKYAQYLPAAGVEVVRHDLWRPAFDRVDLVHFFSAIGGSVHFCEFVRRCDLPLVVSTNLWLTEDTRDLYPIGEIRDQLSLASMVIVNSEAEADQLACVLELPRDRFTRIANGIDPMFLDPVPGHLFRSQFDVAGRFVLNVGNIESRKNQIGLAQAMQPLGVPLILIGQVRDRAYFEAVMAAGRGFTHYLGALQHDDPVLRSAYHACSVFALPSTLETPGLAALEAGACGAPIVITPHGGTREYFRDHAIYVDPAAPEDIRSGLQRALLADRSAALRECLADLVWDRIAVQLAEAYRVILRCAAQSGRLR